MAGTAPGRVRRPPLRGGGRGPSRPRPLATRHHPQRRRVGRHAGPGARRHRGGADPGAAGRRPVRRRSSPCSSCSCSTGRGARPRRCRPTPPSPRRLRADFGVTPSPASHALYEQIVRHDPALGACGGPGSARPRASGCPARSRTCSTRGPRTPTSTCAAVCSWPWRSPAHGGRADLAGDAVRGGRAGAAPGRRRGRGPGRARRRVGVEHPSGPARCTAPGAARIRPGRRRQAPRRASGPPVGGPGNGDGQQCAHRCPHGPRGRRRAHGPRHGRLQGAPPRPHPAVRGDVGARDARGESEARRRGGPPGHGGRGRPARARWPRAFSWRPPSRTAIGAKRRRACITSPSSPGISASPPCAGGWRCTARGWRCSTTTSTGPTPW